MQRKVYEIEPDVLLEGLQLLANENFYPTPQKEEDATTFSDARKPLNSELNPLISLTKLYNWIRACDAEHYPAFFYLGEEKIFVKIWTERSDKNKDEI